MTKEQKAEVKKRIVEYEMDHEIVSTMDGKFSIHKLATEHGVKNRVQWFNIVEVKKGDDYVKSKRTHDYGLIFNNGLEIRRIKKKYFDYFKDVELIEKRERNSNYKLKTVAK